MQIFLGRGVAQLAERSLPIPEICGSNPDTDNFLQNIYYLLSTVLYWKDENKWKKEAGNGPFFKNYTIF